MVFLALFRSSQSLDGNDNELAAESAENEAGSSGASGSGTSTYGAGPSGTGTAGISGAGPSGTGTAGAGPSGTGTPRGSIVPGESQNLIAPSFKAQKCTLWWKAWWLNLAILLLNAGQMSLTAVQSSLHSKAGFGITSMAVGSSASLLGAIMTELVLKMVGSHKKTLVWGLGLCLLGPLNNFYPTWCCMIIASLIAGFAHSVVQVTSEVYTAEFAHWHVGLSEQESKSGHWDRQPESGHQSLESRSDDVQGPVEMGHSSEMGHSVGRRHSSEMGHAVERRQSSEMGHAVERRQSIEIQNSGENIDPVPESLVDSKVTTIMNYYYVFHYSVSKLGYLVGNIGASAILSLYPSNNRTDSTNSTSPAHNGSRPDRDFGYCGAAYCNEDLQSDFNKVPDDQMDLIYGFLGFSLGMCVLSAVVAGFGLDNVNRAQVRPAPETDLKISRWRTVLVTLKETTFVPFRNLQMGLLVIIFVSVSFGDAFWLSDFSKGYVVCFLSMADIGYVLLWIGVAGPIATIATGFIEKPWTRRGFILAARFLHIGLAITLIVWQMEKNDHLFSILCAITGIWNFASGIVLPLTVGLAGCLFKNSLPTALSQLRAWATLAAVVVFACSNALCMDVKLYFIVFVMVVSIIAYVKLELQVERLPRSSE